MGDQRELEDCWLSDDGAMFCWLLLLHAAGYDVPKVDHACIHAGAAIQSSDDERLREGIAKRLNNEETEEEGSRRRKK
jgi:hypothetical protein